MLEDLTLFSMLQKKMDWLARRQEVLSENVANANSPNYQARDLKPLDFKAMVQDTVPTVQAVVTNPMHISPEADKTSFETVKAQQAQESKLNGNTVLLEEQMQKIGEGTSNYNFAINLFKKNISMLETAINKSSSS